MPPLRRTLHRAAPDTDIEKQAHKFLFCSIRTIHKLKYFTYENRTLFWDPLFYKKKVLFKNFEPYVDNLKFGKQVIVSKILAIIGFFFFFSEVIITVMIDLNLIYVPL